MKTETSQHFELIFLLLLFLEMCYLKLIFQKTHTSRFLPLKLKNAEKGWREKLYVMKCNFHCPFLFMLEILEMFKKCKLYIFIDHYYSKIVTKL